MRLTGDFSDHVGRVRRLRLRGGYFGQSERSYYTPSLCSYPYITIEIPLAASTTANNHSV